MMRDDPVRRGAFALAGALLVGGLACTQYDDPLAASRRGAAATPVASGGKTAPPSGEPGVHGGVETASGSPSPASTSTAAPPGASPTAPPTAVPRMAVKAVNVSPRAVEIHPVPRDSAAGLGLTTQVRLAGGAERADGTAGGVRWRDLSGGQLLVGADGLVATSESTRPGLYHVRAEALDDPAVYQDVLVEVRATGELEAVVR